MLVFSPIAVFVSAFIQLRNDGSESKLRFLHFGMTLAGVVVAVLGLEFVQPGLFDGFSDGDWQKDILWWLDREPQATLTSCVASC